MNTWERALSKIETRINAHHFTTWFKPTQFSCEDASSLTIRVPNTWFAEWLKSNYLPLIQQALRDIDRAHVSVAFVPDAEGPSPAPTPARQPRPAAKSSAPALNPRYTFDTFVVSSCNEFAHAAARGVADHTRMHNPLYLYGGVGLGKTHLMQAIGNRVSQKSTGRMRYISAEHFMTDLINAIRFEKTIEFKVKYRNVDLLLIDDIQFLAGKERTQEEFFHTFNALYDAEKQIVITSDCPPREIPTLEERLRSRFEWGLIADIQPPDLETKVAILRKKAEAAGVTLPDDVALFIASNSKTNVRELEGALIRLLAYASLGGKREITLDLATETLRDLLPTEAPAITVESVQKLVANHYNLKVSELKSRNNGRRVAFPRQVAMYVAKQLTSCSLPDIGRRFGGKHHTTVIYAIRKIDEMRSTDPEFDRLVDGLMLSLK